jgi:hypothetical protein
MLVDEAECLSWIVSLTNVLAKAPYKDNMDSAVTLVNTGRTDVSAIAHADKRRETAGASGDLSSSLRANLTICLRAIMFICSSSACAAEMIFAFVRATPIPTAMTVLVAEVTLLCASVARRPSRPWRRVGVCT